LYECETLSLTSREENKFRVSENRALRRIFGPKKEEIIIGGWSKLHNEELYNLYSLKNIITRRMVKLSTTRLTVYAARMRQKCIQSFGRKTWWKETTRKI
jgi:hypothetical protein